MASGNIKEQKVVEWYTFYCEKENREYYYEPISKVSTWVLPPSACFDGDLYKIGRANTDLAASTNSENSTQDKRIHLSLPRRPFYVMTLLVSLTALGLLLWPQMVSVSSQAKTDTNAPAMDDSETIAVCQPPEGRSKVPYIGSDELDSSAANHDSQISVDEDTVVELRPNGHDDPMMVSTNAPDDPFPFPAEAVGGSNRSQASARFHPRISNRIVSDQCIMDMDMAMLTRTTWAPHLTSWVSLEPERAEDLEEPTPADVSATDVEEPTPADVSATDVEEPTPADVSATSVLPPAATTSEESVGALEVSPLEKSSTNALTSMGHMGTNVLPQTASCRVPFAYLYRQDCRDLPAFDTEAIVHSFML